MDPQLTPQDSTAKGKSDKKLFQPLKKTLSVYFRFRFTIADTVSELKSKCKFSGDTGSFLTGSFQCAALNPAAETDCDRFLPLQ